ncbi:MAG: 16S rRNA (cytosine(1402)-N(4))-methyltransferase RsmH [Gammaproteobacteria bacterium]
MSIEHKPVMLDEVVENLAIKPDGIYIDGTFGGGGHSEAILAQLKAEGHLLAIDRDPLALEIAHEKFGGDKRFSVEQASFAQLNKLAKVRGWSGKVNGILLDLGLSSLQLDDAKRGFSFMRDGPLDMRMDPRIELNAASWLARVKETHLAEVLRTYGEERYARRIARHIVAERHLKAITTTSQLVEIIKAAAPTQEKHKHPATRTFQAIRIFINRELDELKEFLENCLEMLATGGRLVIISFHSLEDRIVKRFMHKQAKGEQLPTRLPIRKQQLLVNMRCINGVIKASDKEILNNPRARSAVLRVAEKII